MFKNLLLTFLILFSSLIIIYPSKKENTNLIDYCYSFEKIIYAKLIFGLALIMGSLLFFMSQSKKNESKIFNKSTFLEKRF